MISHLSAGLVLGLSAGLSPGPLLTLVISETLAHGSKAGIRVALAPLVTDLPIVLASLFLIAALKDAHLILGGISLAGSAVIFKMGIESVRTRGAEVSGIQTRPRSLAKGIMVNFLSPHPYIFWISVGGPLVNRAFAQSPLAAAGFVSFFYLMLIGSKVGLALVTARSSRFLTGPWYLFTMRALGVLLCLLGLVLARDGLRLLTSAG